MPASSARLSTTSGEVSSRTAAKVYDHIFDGIAAGDYTKGERLPTELALSDQFGVSRTVVREALTRLRSDGLIQSRRGAGSFVTASPDQAIRRFAPVSSIGDIQRCYEFRIVIEEAASGLAALRRDTDELAEIHQKLLATEVNSDVVLGTDADLDFHIAIAKAAHNRFFVDTLVSLRSHLTVGMQLIWQLSQSRPNDELRPMHTEHRDIFAAIAAGDGPRASAAMKHHLESTRKRVFD